MVDSYQPDTKENPSQVDSIMGAVVKASIDDYIEQVHAICDRDLFPGVSFGDIAKTDPRYQAAEAMRERLEGDLKKLLPKDAYKLLDDYSEAIMEEMTFEANYTYKHGFIDGVAHAQVPVRYAQDIGKTLPLQGGEPR
ncbi:MAG: hypothetical protein AB2L14_27390 [Candidatus Xenobiia bacterium LiM19]